ncbi:PAS domain S-box-containing protein [Methylomagnum ishizawai]|uniref:PAS domain S-box-containing protein n=2 Tax=Methylomagnum ishizawai TaxID=1760988 RepID=A0A1Y6D497_9GAMM|nr:PAS domain S-box-containing protein [Methylomagnum ishizawai]
MIKTTEQATCSGALTVEPETPVAEVLRSVRAVGGGAALVAQGGRLLGLVTLRECVFAALRYRNLPEVAIAELMYSPVPVAGAWEDWTTAYAAMIEQGICHRAVVDAEGHCSGLIGLDDCWGGLVDTLTDRLPVPEQAMSRAVVTVKETDSLLLAIRHMARHAIGCVVVERRGKPAGLLADTDIAPLIQYGVDLATIPASARMGREVPVFPVDGAAAAALAALREPGVRRLVMVDGLGRIVGLLSRHDLLRGLGREQAGSAPAHAVQEGLEWRAIADAGEDAVAILDGAGRVVRANRALAELLRRDRAEILGHPLEAVLNTHNAAPIPRFWLKRRGGDLALAAQDPRNPFGIPVLLGSSPLELDGLALAGQLFSIRDLSGTLRHEERDQLWGALMEQSTEGVLVISAAGGIVEANHAFCEIVGCGEQALLGSELAGWVDHGPAAPLFRALWEAVDSGRDWRGTVLHQGRNGSLHARELRVGPVASGRGAPARYLALVSGMPAAEPIWCGAGDWFEREAGAVGLENQLRRAIERDELSLCYQSQVEIEGGRVVGVEAMVRWQHGERGLIAPDGILPAAERGGFMPELDRWVLRRACAQGRRWLDSGLNFGRITVNVAESHLRCRDFGATVRRILEETGLPAADLEIDIPETALATQDRELTAALDALNRLGVAVAIDNFGTGPTSLLLLASLPVRRLKLDRGVLGAARATGSGLTRAAVAVGRTLGLGIIAKGVETERQRDEWLAEGCGEAQGFLYGRPAPADEIARMLAV